MANNLQSIQLNPNLIVCPGPANKLNDYTDDENSNKNMQANNGITK